jgi:peptidoglycan biosynthesis protein MviN/MurJ (putative lipid II flippase)
LGNLSGCPTNLEERVTRPKLFVGILAAACVGALLWYARLILTADLPRGASIATWVLWAVSAAAVMTLVAYLREFLRHRAAVGREASWKPLPGLVLLWLAGATALVSFAFILPDKSRADGAAEPATASTTVSAQTGTATSGH